MRSLRLAAAMVLLVALTGGPARAADRAVEVPEGPTWYLALGDSLAAGYQPIGRPEDDHRTRSGYADQLWLMARAHYPNLELRNLACPGESTETMRLSHDRCRLRGWQPAGRGAGVHRCAPWRAGLHHHRYRLQRLRLQRCAGLPLPRHRTHPGEAPGHPRRSAGGRPGRAHRGHECLRPLPDPLAGRRG